MKLINESNWKQEIARLKAERILLDQEFSKLFSKFKEDGLVTWYKCDVNILAQKQDVLDKAIETIENVFVHKQCYINL